MQKLLIALLFAASPALAAEKLQVWVRVDPDQPGNTELRDSAGDIVKKFKSKTLELTTDPEKADVTITVYKRFYAPTGDYFVHYNNIGKFATVKEGAKATVGIMVQVPGLEETKFFTGQDWKNSWTGAANNARKNAEKWLEERSKQE